MPDSAAAYAPFVFWSVFVCLMSPLATPQAPTAKSEPTSMKSIT